MSTRRATRATRSANPTQRPMTPAQERRWWGGLLAAFGLLTVIVPPVRDGAGTVFGWAWPLVAVGGVGYGLHLVLVHRPIRPGWRAAAGGLVGFSVLGLSGWIADPVGGFVGEVARVVVAPFGGVALLTVLCSVAAGALLPINWRGLALFVGRETGGVTLRAGETLVAAVKRRWVPVPALHSVPVAHAEATAAPEPSTALAIPSAPTVEGSGAGEVVEPGSSVTPNRPRPAGDECATEAASHEGWTLPPRRLLVQPEARVTLSPADLDRTAREIEQALDDFGVGVTVVGSSPGPAVTQFALQPDRGVSVRRVMARKGDLELALRATAPFRFSPIRGERALGVEIPNPNPALVSIREVVESPSFSRDLVLPVALGTDIAGRPVVGDLTKMPHLLIAGATGQGKSVCINTLICSLMLRATPAQLRMLMIDPKRVELQGYAGVPHLAAPVIVEPHEAAAALGWAVGEMERRYRLLAREDVRNIAGYNERAKEPLPYVVVVIDEFADLMMVAKAEVEELICRIAQKARAIGIHLVIATQRPDATVVTPLIKANVPSRIAFAVDSLVNSRVILDASGAENLLGRGDMLYLPVSATRPDRLQGAFISDAEIEALVWHWREQGEPAYVAEVLAGAAPSPPAAESDRRLDVLFAQAARAVATEGAASVSLVQRRFNVGYSRAGRIVDQLAEHRIVGAYQGSKSRVVLVGPSEIGALLERLQAEGGAVATQSMEGVG
ncbi:MAG TPA: DNA translocase FtsK [Actinomycetota bacterium]|nr:DNA translocase FtsK [Actinomycetota bacterium]